MHGLSRSTIILFHDLVGLKKFLSMFHLFPRYNCPFSLNPLCFQSFEWIFVRRVEELERYGVQHSHQMGRKSPWGPTLSSKELYVFHNILGSEYLIPHPISGFIRNSALCPKPFVVKATGRNLPPLACFTSHFLS